MGLKDKLGDLKDGYDEGHEWGHGFDRDVCEGCPKKKGGAVETCGVCGCPLFNLNMTDAPPSKCPRLDGHEQ